MTKLANYAALVLDKRDESRRAQELYLHAIRADPANTATLYNYAVLTSAAPHACSKWRCACIRRAARSASVSLPSSAAAPAERLLANTCGLAKTAAAKGAGAGAWTRT